MTRIIIIEDELPAYKKLEAYITEHIPDAIIVAWGRSINESKEIIQKTKNVDLVFSDIELLDGNSFEIFEEVKVNCPIIFCTAFDKYLFKAFQSNGIAYILKPYDKENFKEAIDKYKNLFSNKSQNAIEEDVLTELKSLLKGKAYKKRFSVKKKDGIKLLATDDIVSFQANGDFSFAYDLHQKKHVINYPLGQIAAKVNPDQFFRINRSEIINIDFIEKIEPYFKNRLSIRMQNFGEPLMTSSNKTSEFRSWLEK